MPQASRRFMTTRWSLVVAAGDGRSPQAESALATLCEAYWFPVYAFIRRSGKSEDEARDLTQAFFARVIEKNYFKDAREDRGRFRSFLLTSVRHFLSNERDAERALKRGGGQTILSLDVDDGERQYLREPVDADTPEHVYERRWALAVLATAISRLDANYERSSKRAQFLRLKPFLTGDEPESYGALASELGVSDGSLRVAVHRLRRQFAASLRETIAETVATAEDVEDELRTLLAVVSR
jgi:RNA polymerase sigma-70 factor (ECF subfamily)